MPIDLAVAPAYLWVPDHVSSSGTEAADFAEPLGITLDDEQRLVLDSILAEGPGGRWAAFEAAVICSRQNLKTFVFEVAALADLFLFGAELIVWTAHLFPTTMEAFRDIKTLVESHPHLSRRVKKISEANGEEGIELHGGQRILFKARTKTSGRGLTGDRVILDEAFALGPSEMGSLLPTLSARPNPQVLYGSSAGMVTSEVLRGIRDRGRKGGDPSLAYIEWCAPQEGCAEAECDHRYGTEGCVLDDPDRWQRANPAMGRRILATHIAAERRALPPSEFARERLGWWEDPAEGPTGLPLDEWGDCADAGAALADPVAFAIDTSPNNASAAIVACGGPLELIDHRKGSGWVVGRLQELVESHKPSAVGLDPQGPVGSLIPDLERAGFKVRTAQRPDGLLVLLDGRESVQACGGFLSAVVDHELEHRDQAALNDAVEGAVRRQVGDAWKWSRRNSSVDISPLVAATVARFLWVSATEPAEPFLIVT